MNPRALVITLIASVAVNLFAVATGVTLLLAQSRADARLEESRQPGREQTYRDILRTLDPEVRRQVRTALRESAQAARPDFQEARAARREAIALAQGDAFDAAAVTALLERSRAAETRGRARIETDSIAILQTLEPDDRQALSVLLTRHRKNRDRARDVESPPASAARQVDGEPS